MGFCLSDEIPVVRTAADILFTTLHQDSGLCADRYSPMGDYQQLPRPALCRIRRNQQTGDFQIRPDSSQRCRIAAEQSRSHRFRRIVPGTNF